ncbi:hypothetical protein [Vibrio agarivorans]|uniref:hypothetical protein n=1 Tax=Vibrio agarivorans TaxID=153622 RepID=UPI0025B4DDAC|nr:hypothetical protein [Vibrio agarivorans]MDN3661176.1 hypothetical protein [Vibrio agarivorans]
MKRTLISIATVAIITISGSVTAGLNIDRTGTTISTTKSYDQIRNGLGLSFSYVDHDDSVGTRGSSSSTSGSSVVNTDTSKANDTLGTINCSHQAYKTLCKEIEDMIKDAYEPPVESEPDYSAEKAACEAKSPITWSEKVGYTSGLNYCSGTRWYSQGYVWDDSINQCVSGTKETTKNSVTCTKDNGGSK